MGLAAVTCWGEDPVATSKTAPSSPTDSDPQGEIARITADSKADSKEAESKDAMLPAPVAPEIRQLFTRLESASNFLRDTKRYAATFTQQVHKNGQLYEPERIELKVQHEPFAVFMQWERDGQQALYVNGEHENKLLVHPTRGIGRLRRVWILEPESGLAMRGAVRPVTEIGMLNMVDLLLDFHREHILCSHCNAEPCQKEDQSLTRFVLTFDTPEHNPYFAKTNLWLCDERHIPLRIENYSWAEDDRVGPLRESYDYSDVCLDDCGLTEADFDRDNEAYSF